MHTSLQHTSTTLAMEYQTTHLILMIFPKWTWTAPFVLPLAKIFDMPRPGRSGSPVNAIRAVHCSQYPYPRLAQTRRTPQALKAHAVAYTNTINARTSPRQQCRRHHIEKTHAPDR